MKFVLKFIFQDDEGENIEEFYVSDNFDEIINILHNIDYFAYELFYISDYVRLY